MLRLAVLLKLLPRSKVTKPNINPILIEVWEMSRKALLTFLNEVRAFDKTHRQRRILSWPHICGGITTTTSLGTHLLGTFDILFRHGGEMSICLAG